MTIIQDDFPENGSLDDFSNAVYGRNELRNVIRDGLPVNIVDGHNRHAVFGALL